MKKMTNYLIHPLDVSFDWKTVNIKSLDFTECQTLTVWHHSSKERDLKNLPDIIDLKNLIVISSNIETLCGIEKYPHLETLDLSYVSKLAAIENIQNVKSLRLLSIFNAKKINDYSKIGMLKGIETLRICDSGNIQDINFISDMPKLKSFSFAGSNVVDGNLIPILNHIPPLEFVGFNNKRHYSHSWEKVCEQLNLRDLIAYSRSLKKHL